jgi:hypothetical protein
MTPRAFAATATEAVRLRIGDLARMSAADVSALADALERHVVAIDAMPTDDQRGLSAETLDRLKRLRREFARVETQDRRFTWALEDIEARQ